LVDLPVPYISENTPVTDEMFMIAENAAAELRRQELGFADM